MSKEFLWFNPRLLDLPVNNVPELQWHREWYRLTGMNICLVDSSGLSAQYGNGVNIKNIVEPTLGFDLHRNTENGQYWHNNFSDLIRKISDGIFDRAEGKDELRISYSGGTDSALALAGLWSNHRIQEWIARGKFIIYTTPHAKKEDPGIWDRIVTENIPLRFMDYDELSVDESNSFMVSGEGDGYCVWFKVMSRAFTDHEIFVKPLNEIMPKVEQWFLTRDKSAITWDFFRKLIETADYEIATLFQAWSLFEATCAQQCYLLRVSAYGRGPAKLAPRHDWAWFMADSDFWDVCEYETRNKIYTSDSTLKFKPLKYISNWMGWTSIQTKKKISSQILIPKLIRKNQIFSDMTHTGDVSLWQ